MPEENKSKQEGSGMTDAQDKLESSKTHARKAAEDLKSAAGAIAGEYRGKAEQAWGDARGKAEQAWGDATDARPHISRRRRAIRARKPDQGGLYRARNRVCPGPDLPALIALRSNDQRTYSVPQSGGACRFAGKFVGAGKRACGIF